MTPEQFNEFMTAFKAFSSSMQWAIIATNLVLTGIVIAIWSRK